MGNMCIEENTGQFTQTPFVIIKKIVNSRSEWLKILSYHNRMANSIRFSVVYLTINLIILNCLYFILKLTRAGTCNHLTATVMTML